MSGQERLDEGIEQFLLDVFERLGFPRGDVAEAYRNYSGKSLSFHASQIHERFVDITPQAISTAEFIVAKVTELGWSLVTKAQQILNDENIQVIIRSQVAEPERIPKEILRRIEQAKSILLEAKSLGILAEEVKNMLREFNEGKPNALACLILMPKLMQMQPHEFMQSMSKEGENIDLLNPVDYVMTVFLALCLGREDLIVKAVHFRLANHTTVGLIKQKYVELGGPQSLMEETAKDYIDGQVNAITEASLFNGTAARQAEQALIQLEPLLSQFQKEAIKELEESKTWEDLSNARSLDAEIQGENGEITTLSEMLPISPDLDEAMPEFLEIWGRLDSEDAELLKERYIDGKDLKEIAIERGWEYDRTQKRILRLVKDLVDKISE